MAQVSVIVPVYNVEAYLRRCVDSILGQTFRDFELILVDDGSPDKCGEICDEYAKRDGRVAVIHQKNGGLSAARNAGIDWVFANSKSEYIGFIDSDDWIAPNYLEELHKGCQICDVACVAPSMSSDDTMMPSRGDVKWDLMPPSIYWQSRMLPMTAWGKLFKRDLWKDVRFPSGKIHEDEYVIPAVLFSCRQIASSDAKLYLYYKRSDSIVGENYSIKRLDAVEALIAQSYMFSGMGYYDLARKAKISLCQCYSDAILLLRRNEYVPLLCALLKELQLPTIQFEYYYKAAYPLKARVLLPFARIIDLLMRRNILDIVRRFIVKIGMA